MIENTRKELVIVKTLQVNVIQTIAYFDLFIKFKLSGTEMLPN